MQEALDDTNSPRLCHKKCIQDSMENMPIDVRI